MQRPNILILSTDQLRWDAIGANGNPDVQTPMLDRLAADGLTFTRYFVQNPVCMPSRLSFLTGQYPSTLRVTHMGVPVPLDTITLPRLLRPYGYASANVGKLHFLPHANRDHREPHPSYGFDTLELSDEPGPYEDAYRAWVRRVAPDEQAALDAVSPGLPPLAETWRQVMHEPDPVRHPAVRFPKAPRPFGAPAHLTHSAFVADQSMEFIRQQRHRPWLCIAGFYSPHSPWIAPQEFLDRYDPSTFRLPVFPPDVDALRPGTEYDDAHLRAARHGYYAMVSEVDHHAGRILALLDDLSLAENTIVLLTSDHGDWLGEHLRHGKGYPAADPVSRVPLLVRWPAGVRHAGRAVAAITEAVDVLPTLLECAGIQVPPHVQGRSFLPLLEDRATAGRPSALTEAHGWKALRTSRYRYVCRFPSPAGAPPDAATMEEHLWDLERDPGEYHDLAADPAASAALADLRRHLLQRVLEQEQPRRRIWPY